MDLRMNTAKNRDRLALVMPKAQEDELLGACDDVWNAIGPDMEQAVNEYGDGNMDNECVAEAILDASRLETHLAEERYSGKLSAARHGSKQVDEHDNRIHALEQGLKALRALSWEEQKLWLMVRRTYA